MRDQDPPDFKSKGYKQLAQFINQAQLIYNGEVVSSNIAVGEILASLNASKQAVNDTYSPGDSVTYVIGITNTSSSEIVGISVNDDLGAYDFGTNVLQPLDYVDGSVLLYINGLPTAAPAVDITQGVTFSGISIPAGGNALVIYETRVNEFAPLDTQGSITNTATVNGGCTPVNVTETVTPDNTAILNIDKSISPGAVSCGDRITYTFVIQNRGNTAVDGGAVIQDVFSPILADIVVTGNGVAWTEGVEYTYDEATGTFASIAGAITVPAATYTQNIETGVITVNPGEFTITVTGTLNGNS